MNVNEWLLNENDKRNERVCECVSVSGKRRQIKKGAARGLEVSVLLLEARRQETGGFTSCHHGLNRAVSHPPDTHSEDTQRRQGRPVSKRE